MITFVTIPVDWFLFLLWWPILELSILLCCNADTVNELEAVDYTREFTVHVSSNIFSVAKLDFTAA